MPFHKDLRISFTSFMNLHFFPASKWLQVQQVFPNASRLSTNPADFNQMPIFWLLFLLDNHFPVSFQDEMNGGLCNSWLANNTILELWEFQVQPKVAVKSCFKSPCLTHSITRLSGMLVFTMSENMLTLPYLYLHNFNLRLCDMKMYIMMVEAHLSFPVALKYQPILSLCVLITVFIYYTCLKSTILHLN